MGPLIVAAVLFYKGSYEIGSAFLLIPALMALAVLIISRFLYPYPHDLEVQIPHLKVKGFKSGFWIYLIAAALIAAGFADFPLIAFHFQTTSILSEGMIPIYYAMAMGVDAIAALIFGRLFDKFGLSIMIIIALLSSLFPPLVFFGGSYPALLGMALWGLEYGSSRIHYE